MKVLNTIGNVAAVIVVAAASVAAFLFFMSSMSGCGLLDTQIQTELQANVAAMQNQIESLDITGLESTIDGGAIAGVLAVIGLMFARAAPGKTFRPWRWGKEGPY